MPANSAAYQRAWRHEHPELRLLYDRRRDRAKIRARSKLGHAVRSGQLERQPCAVCGSTYRVEGHHADYSRPLAVEWLCREHHLERHRPEAVAA